MVAEHEPHGRDAVVVEKPHPAAHLVVGGVGERLLHGPFAVGSLHVHHVGVEAAQRNEGPAGSSGEVAAGTKADRGGAGLFQRQVDRARAAAEALGVDRLYHVHPMSVGIDGERRSGTALGVSRHLGRIESGPRRGRQTHAAAGHRQRIAVLVNHLHGERKGESAGGHRAAATGLELVMVRRTGQCGHGNAWRLDAGGIGRGVQHVGRGAGPAAGLQHDAELAFAIGDAGPLAAIDRQASRRFVGEQLAVAVGGEPDSDRLARHGLPPDASRTRTVTFFCGAGDLGAGRPWPARRRPGRPRIRRAGAGPALVGQLNPIHSTWASATRHVGSMRSACNTPPSAVRSRSMRMVCQAVPVTGNL